MNKVVSINLKEDTNQFKKFNEDYPETICQVLEFSQNKKLKNNSQIKMDDTNKNDFLLTIKTMNCEDNKRIYYEINSIMKMKQKFIERKNNYLLNKQIDLENYDQDLTYNKDKKVKKNSYKFNNKITENEDLKIETNKNRKNNPKTTKIVETFLNFNKKKHVNDKKNSDDESESVDKQISDNEYIN